MKEAQTRSEGIAENTRARHADSREVMPAVVLNTLQGGTRESVVHSERAEDDQPVGGHPTFEGLLKHMEGGI
jgi:hypothetical protein